MRSAVLKDGAARSARAGLRYEAVAPRRLSVMRAHHNPFADPYSTLGLEPGATPDEVKSAYRKLAKRLHPDVSKSNTELQFLSITEAYEFLIHLTRGKDAQNPDGTPRPANSEAFHDWYWSFRMSRTWQAQKAKAASTSDPEVAGAPPPHTSAVQSQEGLRSQLAGLRHRAAIRKHRPASAPPAASQQGSEDEHGEQGEDLRESDRYCVAAEGPSDSADVPITVVTQTQQDGEGEGDASEQQEHHTPPPGAGAHRRFVSNSNVREGLKAQLHGMRRKAALRQELHTNA